MRCIALGQRLFRAAVPVAMTLLGACGGAEPAQTQAHAPTHADTRGRANMQPTSPPNTPTASNIQISEEILRACNIPDADAYFAFDSAQLTKFDHTALDKVATCFRHGPMAGRKMRLVGHADPRGPDEYNMTLGQSRADEVMGYLLGRGLGRAQATTTSRGEADATGTDETGWAHDRRVDVMLAP